jgi:hypothetical protein
MKRAQICVREKALSAGAWDLTLAQRSELQESALALAEAYEAVGKKPLGGKRGPLAFAVREIMKTLHSFAGGGFVIGSILCMALKIMGSGDMDGGGVTKRARLKAASVALTRAVLTLEEGPGAGHARSAGSVLRALPASSKAAMKVIVKTDLFERWLESTFSGREGRRALASEAWVGLGEEATALSELVATYKSPEGRGRRTRDERDALRKELCARAASFGEARGRAAYAQLECDAAKSPGTILLLGLMMWEPRTIERLALVLVPQLTYAPHQAWEGRAYRARLAQAAVGVVGGATGGNPPGKGARTLGDDERALFAAVLRIIAIDEGKGPLKARGLPLFADDLAAAAATTAAEDATISRGPPADDYSYSEEVVATIVRGPPEGDYSYSKKDVAAADDEFKKIVSKKWWSGHMAHNLPCDIFRYVPATVADATKLLEKIIEQHDGTLRSALNDAISTFTAARSGGGGGQGGGGGGGGGAAGGGGGESGGAGGGGGGGGGGRAATQKSPQQAACEAVMATGPPHLFLLLKNAGVVNLKKQFVTAVPLPRLAEAYVGWLAASSPAGAAAAAPLPQDQAVQTAEEDLTRLAESEGTWVYVLVHADVITG